MVVEVRMVWWMQSRGAACVLSCNMSAWEGIGSVAILKRQLRKLSRALFVSDIGSVPEEIDFERCQARGADRTVLFDF